MCSRAVHSQICITPFIFVGRERSHNKGTKALFQVGAWNGSVQCGNVQFSDRLKDVFVFEKAYFRFDDQVIFNVVL